MATDDVLAIIDTSSIVEIRRSIANTRKRGIFDALATLAENHKLYFPKEVLRELERVADPLNPDQQFAWAKRVAEAATNVTVPFETVREVLALVPRVIDPDRQGSDEADPYILALAIELQKKEKRVLVVTEERHDTPTKMSLRTAAGVLGLPSIPLMAFLDLRSIR